MTNTAMTKNNGVVFDMDGVIFDSDRACLVTKCVVK